MPAPWSSGALVRVVGRLQGQDCINTYHFATNEVVNDPSALAPLLVALATAMLQCVIDNMMDSVTSDYTLLMVDARQIHPTISDPVEVAAPANTVGTRSATSVSFAASLINWRSTRGGRRGHGKTFIAPPGELDMQNSLIGAVPTAGLAAYIDCLLGKFKLPDNTENWIIGVLSSTIFKQAVGGGFDNAFAPITAGIVSDRAAKIGSRKLGSGN